MRSSGFVIMLRAGVSSIACAAVARPLSARLLSALAPLLLLPLMAWLSPAAAELQRNVSPDGHTESVCECRPATEMERQNLALAPDGWVQAEPREAYDRGTVPLPLVPDWVGTRTRAVGALVWFDADADGDQDLFVGTYWANQWPPLEDYYNFMYLNTGGVLESDPSWISSDQKHTGSAQVGFINNDMYPDLFLANGGTSFQPSQVFYGQDGLLPTTAGWQNAGGTWATGCSLADFDLDGDLDVATSNQGVQPSPYRPTYVYRNLGNGLETTPFWQSNQVGITSDCDWGDMDGDGYPELAVSGWVGWETGVFHNLGTTLDANFSWTSGDPSRTDKGVRWADADGDQHLDLAVGGNGDPDWLFRNEGTLLGSNPVWASGEPYTGCQDMAWVDIDRDGDPDLAMIHFSTGHVRIYLNDGGTLSSIADWQYDAVSSGTSLGFGDLNGDGWMDLAIGVANGPVEVFINRQLPASTEQIPAGPTHRQALQLQVSPNPLRGSLALTLQSPIPVALGKLELIDLGGRRVARHTPGHSELRQTQTIVWERSGRTLGNLPPGVYLLRVTAVDAQRLLRIAESRIVWLGS